MWATDGVVMDAGTAAGGKSGVNPNTLGITAPGTPFCITDVPTTPAPNGYYQLCFGANSLGGGLISYNAYGAALPQPLQADVNGSIFAVGSGVPQPVVNGMCLIGVGGMAVWGSCSGAGTAVSSVTGTVGQILASPTTGGVILSLPSTISANLTFSGPITFTGSVGGTALSAYLAAPPPIGSVTPNSGAFSSIVDTMLAGSGNRCVHVDPLGTLGVAATDCGAGGGGGGISSLTFLSPLTGGTITTSGSPGLAFDSTLSVVSGALHVNASPPAIPNASLLSGNGTTLGGVSLGTGLSITGTFPTQTLNAAGGTSGVTGVYQVQSSCSGTGCTPVLECWALSAGQVSSISVGSCSMSSGIGDLAGVLGDSSGNLGG